MFIRSFYDFLPSRANLLYETVLTMYHTPSKVGLHLIERAKKAEFLMIICKTSQVFIELASSCLVHVALSEGTCTCLCEKFYAGI